MFHLIVLLIKSLFLLFSGKKRDVVIENLILKKEITILKRKNKKRIRFKFIDKLFYAVFNKISYKLKECITLIKPETVLKWQRDLIKKFWAFPSKKAKVGRPPVPGWIKNLILEIKNKNLLWGCKRIQGELLKLGIELHKKTIGNILRDFRRKGDRSKNVRQQCQWPARPCLPL